MIHGKFGLCRGNAVGSQLQDSRLLTLKKLIMAALGLSQRHLAECDNRQVHARNKSDSSIPSRVSPSAGRFEGHSHLRISAMLRSNNRRRFTSPFDPLALSPMDVAQLERLAEVVVQDHLIEYERFVAIDARKVDDSRWKFVKQQDNVAAFVERRKRKKVRATSSMSNFEPSETSNSASSSSSSSTIVAGDNVPVLLATGTVEGTLDDIMFGTTNLSAEAVRIKTAYVEDNVVDCAVLATLASPTAKDPFRSLTVKWFEVGQPLHIRSVVKNRDFVVLEATGLAQLSNGERVGYQVQHSVHFPQTRELDSQMRGNLSVCGIVVQRVPYVVEIYTKGFLNPAGGLLRSVVVKSAAHSMTTTSRYVLTGRMRKLTWAVQRRHSRPLQDISDDWTPANATSKLFKPGEACAACKKTIARRILGSNGSVCCKLCLLPICSNCKIKKKLFYISSTAEGNRLVQQELSFCARCLQESTVRADSLAIASDEFLLTGLQTGDASGQRNSHQMMLSRMATISDVAVEEHWD